MNDVTTRIINLPTTIRAYTKQTADGSYTVFVNARLSRDMQIKAYRHEVEHISGQDFEKEDVQEIEGNAHRNK